MHGMLDNEITRHSATANKRDENTINLDLLSKAEYELKSSQDEHKRFFTKMLDDIIATTLIQVGNGLSYFSI